MAILDVFRADGPQLVVAVLTNRLPVTSPRHQRPNLEKTKQKDATSITDAIIRLEAIAETGTTAE